MKQPNYAGEDVTVDVSGNHKIPIWQEHTVQRSLPMPVDTVTGLRFPCSSCIQLRIQLGIQTADLDFTLQGASSCQSVDDQAPRDQKKAFDRVNRQQRVARPTSSDRELVSPMMKL